MQWLSEIFESSSDQARLVTTLIAAFIAVAVVFVNQLFNTRRARKDKNIQKIEDLYLVFIKLQDLITSIHAEIITRFENEADSKIIHQLHEDFSRTGANAHMLTGLYVPSLSKSVGEIWTRYDNLYQCYCEAENLAVYAECARQHKTDMDIIFLNVYQQLSEIMKKTMH